MDNIDTTPKRGRPPKTIAETSATNRRNEVALSVLSAAVSSGVTVTDSKALIKWCFAMADQFIEIADE